MLAPRLDELGSQENMRLGTNGDAIQYFGVLRREFDAESRDLAI